jgi:tRNA threonylcarbamoyladenosine biosynthesis protein TsaB
MVVCIETATNICSVALCSSDGITALKESTDLKSHASSLTVFIDEILRENQVRPADLEAVATAKGPGSYTGLRIGVSVATGLAFAASIPLIGIETTLSMFWGIVARAGEITGNSTETLLCPMIDARRMEVYHAVYNTKGIKVKEISAEIITEESFSDFPERQAIVFFGDGAAKCRGIIKRKNIYFADDFRISASYMQVPVYEAIRDKKFEDVAYFEPFYLKDFITSVPRKNILGK